MGSTPDAPHPEERCHRCGGRNPTSWSVDSDRWNTAFPDHSDAPYGGIVCPGCFVEAHEKATGLIATWRLVPDQFLRTTWAELQAEARAGG